MTTSPYDSLPSGNNDITADTNLSESNDTAIPASVPQPDTAPKYVDVEIAPPPAPIVETASQAKPATPTPIKESPPVPQPKPSPQMASKPEHHTPAKPATQMAPKSAPHSAKTVPLVPPPQYTNISIKNLQGHCEYILPFEESLLVPDTMPDMHKVLFAEGRVDLAQPLKASYDKNDFLAGDITAYTVYRPVPSTPSPSAGPAGYNDCPVDVVKSVIPFKTDKCWANASGDSFKPTVTIRSINAEMINERKFIVRGELLIKMSCIADCEMKVFKSSSDNDLITLKGSGKATGLDNEMSETTEISQEITIRDGQPAPVKILKTSINVVENHRQLTSGKLVINASIHLDALYLGEEDDGQKKLCCLTNKTDFTQFIVMDDKADPELICIDFGCGGLSLTTEGKDKFMLQGNVTSLIRSYCSKDIDLVMDAYHKKKDLHFDLVSKKMNCVKGTVSGEISAREVVNLTDSDKKPAALLCGNCRISSIEGRLDKGRIVIEGAMPVKILALDEEDIPFVIDHNVPVRGSLEMAAASLPAGISGLKGGGHDSEPKICIDTAVKEFWFSEINSRQMEINTVLAMTVWVTAEETFCTIDDLRFTEDDVPPARTPMALYVVGSEDTLWDVAKRYKTDINMLAALNDLDPDKPLPAGAKLFIAK